MPDAWRDVLWAQGADIYDAILAHPFLAGLTDGSLPPEVFAEYLAQDAHYLRDYARALAVLGSRAPTHALAGLFAGHAAQTVQVELALHAELLPALGLDAAAVAAVPASPTTVAYTNFLLRTVVLAPFTEGLAAVLPCYWIYQRVGAELVGRGSPDPRFQRWIDTYAGDGFAATVDTVLDVVDDVGRARTQALETAAGEHYRTAARYEWLFWDAAHRIERWPL